jgi:hypothetical protein
MRELTHGFLQLFRVSIMRNLKLFEDSAIISLKLPKLYGSVISGKYLKNKTKKNHLRGMISLSTNAKSQLSTTTQCPSFP